MRYWTPKKIHGKPLVGIAVACYLETAREAAALATLVESFRAQTYDRWRLLLVHDGPPLDATWSRLKAQADARVGVRVTPERTKQFGHPHRQDAIEYLLKEGCTHIGLTNQDNYYVPVYLEWLLSVATNPKKPRELVYCDLVHSHKMWRQMITEPKRSKLDLGAWLASANLIKQVRFDNFAFDGDGVFIERMRSKARGIEKVAATLMVHN